jgi:hypothetical protein
MRIKEVFGKIMPATALLAAVGLSSCDDMTIEMDGEQGVPLAELDMSGDPPSGVVLASPDNVVITSGDEFTINVEGGAEESDRMRFALDDGTLAIHRENGDWGDDAKATVNVTIPAPESLVMAGSGTITVDAMGSSPEITIAGSGTATANGLEAERLELTVAGSGTVNASGRTDRMELTVAGSGSANMEDLQVGDAEVTIAGSGDAAFASDGNVEADVVGSGTVRVRGSASCEINSLGPGELICEDVAEAEDA